MTSVKLKKSYFYCRMRDDDAHIGSRSVDSISLLSHITQQNACYEKRCC